MVWILFHKAFHHIITYPSPKIHWLNKTVANGFLLKQRTFDPNKLEIIISSVLLLLLLLFLESFFFPCQQWNVCALHLYNDKISRYITFLLVAWDIVEIIGKTVEKYIENCQKNSASFWQFYTKKLKIFKKKFQTSNVSKLFYGKNSKK